MVDLGEYEVSGYLTNDEFNEIYSLVGECKINIGVASYDKSKHTISCGVIVEIGSEFNGMGGLLIIGIYRPIVLNTKSLCDHNIKPDIQGRSMVNLELYNNVNELNDVEQLEFVKRWGDSYNISIDSVDVFKQETYTLGNGSIITFGIPIKGNQIDVDFNIVRILRLKIDKKNNGMKFDDDKLLCMAFPAKEYKQILEVLTNGANKYKIDNWKHVEDGRNRYMNGLERHFLDYKEAIQTGNDELKFDNGEGGMGTNHLANLICNAIFLLYFDNNNID